eukprot:SAG11_NODE_4105_length_2063_cov_1.399185_1_plen_24_part_10
MESTRYHRYKYRIPISTKTLRLDI